MSIKEKDFIKAIKKITSSDENPEFKLRKLEDAYIKYLKYSHGMYSQSAIKSIQKSIISKYKDKDFPVELHGLILETAKYYKKIGELETAISLLEKITDSRNITYMLQAKYELNMIKLKQGLEKETVDTERIEEIKNLVKHDEDNEIGTATSGEFSDYDIFCSYFGEKIPIDAVGAEIFPVNMEKTTKSKEKTDTIIPGPQPGPEPKGSPYREELSANNRLKFLVDNFKIAYARPGEGKFTGAILFEIEDSDLVIVESFWREGKNGEPPVEDSGKATYILPKDQSIDLIELSRGEIKAKQNPRIKTVNHSKEYYNNLVSKFNEAQGTQFEKIENKNNPSRGKNFDSEYRPNEGKTEIGKNVEETEKISSSENIGKSNEEFLQMINKNLGDIITPEIMEGLLKRASYSFENVYNRKLKSEIIARLEFLGVDKNVQEIEAQKVFLYMRMAKNISMINSSAINGEKLDEILDDSVCEYEIAFEFFQKHISEGLSYNEMKKALKEFIEKGKDPLEEEESSNDIKNDENDKKIIKLKETKGQPQSEQGENPLKTLFDEKVKNGTESKVADMISRYLDLLAKLEKLNSEIERLNREIAEKEAQHKLSQQEKIKALEKERLARLETQAAKKKENNSAEALEETKKTKETIEKEKKAIADKIATIEDLLK